MISALIDHLIKKIHEMTTNDEQFIESMKKTFSITDLCSILEINRNRYNYLVKKNKLDLEILRFKVQLEMRETK